MLFYSLKKSKETISAWDILSNLPENTALNFYSITSEGNRTYHTQVVLDGMDRNNLEAVLREVIGPGKFLVIPWKLTGPVEHRGMRSIEVSIAGPPPNNRAGSQDLHYDREGSDASEDQRDILSSEQELQQLIIGNFQELLDGRYTFLHSEFQVSRAGYAGRLDIVALDLHTRRLTVFELKKGLAERGHLGQLLSYIPYIGEVSDQIAENTIQPPKGILICARADPGLLNAAAAVEDVQIWYYRFDSLSNGLWLGPVVVCCSRQS